MRIGKWLNSLSGLDYIVILFCFGLAVLLSHFILRGIRQFYNQLQKDNPYAPEFRITPTLFFITALPLTTGVYFTIGTMLTGWLSSIIH